MKIVDEKETHKTAKIKTTKKDRKEQGRTETTMTETMSLWKEFQLLQILSNLSIRHLNKLILYENDVKLLKFKIMHRSICDMFEEWHFDYWHLEWLHPEKRWNGKFVFSIVNSMLGCL